MVEVKSVKVDNWGVFFLQKLQNFFNKTDYCDLTLQFQDNSQLKVHRLVLSACTDYFNLLEQQYEIVDDILIMPRDLQADVVVPIVNFMYTGTLEFEVSMYGRLLKTAKDMNMTVLLKLLEAHKRAVEPTRPPPQPVLLNKNANQRVNTYSRSATASTSSSMPTGQRTYTPRKPQIKKPGGPIQQHQRSPSTSASATATSYIKRLPDSVQLVPKYKNTASTPASKGPSRFDCSEDSILPDHFESSFDNISYESRPLITARQIIKEEKDLDDETPSTSSSFEQLRKGYTNNKRPLSSPSYTASPPEKKPNLQDIMEYTEAERVRKEIVAEEFEGTEYVEDNFSTDDQDVERFTQSSKVRNPASKMDKTPPMVFKNDSGNVNHAKIISEVLKKYPHLVKNNKNIKLKIMQKGSSTQTHVVQSSSTAASTSSTVTSPKAQVSVKTVSTTSANFLPPPSTSSASTSASTSATTSAPATSSAPKKIDSKTMHALIAKGAENMTGPWLCLKCGINGRPISIPSYKSFRRHLISVHREKIDPKLCEHCGWRSQNRLELYHHILVTHNIKVPSEYNFPRCNDCSFVAIDAISLNKHKNEQHPKSKLNAHHCIYCNKTFSNEILVYAHMRNFHKERACEDGVMDFDEDDEEMMETEMNKSEMNTSEGKIKIISDIALPSKGIQYVFDASGGTIVPQGSLQLDSGSEAEGSTIASGLTVLDSNVVISNPIEFPATTSGTTTAGNTFPSQYIESALADVHGEYSKKGTDITQFVTEEGSSLELSASQKADLLQQLQDNRGVVMILNDDGFAQNQQIITQEDGQNIVVVYSQAGEIGKDGTVDHSTTTVASTSGTDIANSVQQSHSGDPLKDIEDIDLEQSDELLIEMKSKPSPKRTKQKLSTKKLLSTLEGDWSDDEAAEEKSAEHAEEATNKKQDSNENTTDTVTVKEELEDDGKNGEEQKKETEEKDEEDDKMSNEEFLTARRLRSTVSESDDKKKVLRRIERPKTSAATVTARPKLVRKKRSEEIPEKEVEQNLETKDEDENKSNKNQSDTEDTAKDGEEVKIAEKSKGKKETKSTKTDLNTLINDWGDDDNDDDGEEEEEENEEDHNAASVTTAAAAAVDDDGDDHNDGNENNENE